MMSIMPTRRQLLAGAAAVAAVCPHIRTAGAAAWPDRTITLLHGFAPGGNADVLARILVNRLPSRLGQSVIVDARPGAGGTTAALQVARSPADGYTLMMVVAGHATYPSIYKSLKFDPLADFTFIGMAAEYPFILATYPDSPIRTPTDLVTEAKTRSEPITFGSPGVGTAHHFAMEYFCASTGIKLQHIPYRGNTQGTTDVLARRIDLMIEAPAGLLTHINNKSLHAIGVTSNKRFFALPDVPSFSECGLPDFSVTSWSGLGAPANLPDDIVQRLNTEMRAILAEPDVIQSVHNLGNDVAPSSPEAFRRRVESDVAKWADVATKAGIVKI